MNILSLGFVIIHFYGLIFGVVGLYLSVGLSGEALSLHVRIHMHLLSLLLEAYILSLSSCFLVHSLLSRACANSVISSH